MLMNTDLASWIGPPQCTQTQSQPHCLHMPTSSSHAIFPSCLFHFYLCRQEIATIPQIVKLFPLSHRRIIGLHVSDWPMSRPGVITATCCTRFALPLPTTPVFSKWEGMLNVNRIVGFVFVHSPLLLHLRFTCLPCLVSSLDLDPLCNHSSCSCVRTRHCAPCNHSNIFSFLRTPVQLVYDAVCIKTSTPSVTCCSL